MKLSLLTACTLAGAVSFSQLAQADEPQVVRVRFPSTATHDVVQRAACSFDAASTFDGRDHDFDFRVSGFRCPNRALNEGAITLFVRLEHGDEDRVVVETSVPEGMNADNLRTAVMEITSELKRRVERTPVAPVVVTTTTTPTQLTPVRNYGWARNDGESTAESDWYKPRTKRASPGLMAGGILLITAGSLATFGGLISVAANMSYGNAAPGALVFTAGLAGLVSGIPMLVAGSKKVPAVTASVSPTGGNVRVTF